MFPYPPDLFGSWALCPLCRTLPSGPQQCAGGWILWGKVLAHSPYPAWHQVSEYCQLSQKTCCLGGGYLNCGVSKFSQSSSLCQVYGSEPSQRSFPCGSAGKESACNAGDLGSIPRLGRSPGEGKDYLPQYSGLENSMNRIVHGVAKSLTQVNDFHFHFQCNSKLYLVDSFLKQNILWGCKESIL